MRLTVHSGLLLVAALLSMGSVAEAAPATPKEMVAKIYNELAKDKFAGGKDAPSATTEAADKLSRQWFTDRFLEARKADDKCWSDEREGVGNLWFRRPGLRDQEGGRLGCLLGERREVLDAELENFGEAQTVRYEFQKTAQGWRIDDIRRDGQSLFETMKKGCREAPPADTTDGGETGPDDGPPPE